MILRPIENSGGRPYHQDAAGTNVCAKKHGRAQMIERIASTIEANLFAAAPERRQDEHVNGEQDEFRAPSHKKDDDETSMASRGCADHA